MCDKYAYPNAASQVDHESGLQHEREEHYGVLGLRGGEEVFDPIEVRPVDGPELTQQQ